MPMTILAVFRSRTQSVDYVRRLTGYGITAQTVSTPREIKIGCGLSVTFDSAYFARARAVLALGKYSAFKGFYKLGYLSGSPTFLPYADR